MSLAECRPPLPKAGGAGRAAQQPPVGFLVEKLHLRGSGPIHEFERIAGAPLRSVRTHERMICGITIRDQTIISEINWVHQALEMKEKS